MSGTRGADPFEDVRRTERGFSIPDMKWRELLFIGAFVADGDGFRRDLRRPLPPFRAEDLFPEDARFHIARTADRVEIVLPARSEVPVAPDLWIGGLAAALRLEAAEVAGAVAACGVDPAAAALPIAGGLAAFQGQGSPLTHVVGVGMQGPVTATELDAIERFYAERDSGVELAVCPLADAGLLPLLAERGYRLIGLEHLLARRLDGEIARLGLPIEAVAGADESQWNQCIARGFAGDESLVPADVHTGSMLFRSSQPFWVRLGGRPAGGACLGVWAGVASLFADATLPSQRGRGIQSALIQHRLAAGRAAGCKLAMAAVQPGSPSHRNYVRAGFQVAYTRAILSRTGS